MKKKYLIIYRDGSMEQTDSITDEHIAQADSGVSMNIINIKDKQVYIHKHWETVDNIKDIIDSKPLLKTNVD